MSVRGALVACALLLAAFGAVALWAVRRESPTFDEPVQTVAGWIKLHRGDFRINIEDPPLWEEWAALPHGPSALKPEFDSGDWKTLLDTPARQWRFVTHNLWTTDGVDGLAFVNRSRVMMLLVGLALGAFLAFFAWRLAGPVAGVVALTLYAFDPNFLAHAPLVKNDVPASLAMLACAYFTWRLGQRITVLHAFGLAFTFGIALNLKFSCVLLVPMLGLLLALRAVISQPWAIGDRLLIRRGLRVLASAGLVGLLTVVSFTMIWAAYRFRFSATPDPTEHIDTQWVMGHLERAQKTASGATTWVPDLVTRTVLWMLSHRVLPESWLNGFLFTYATAVLRRGFLLGELSATGFWYYFPVALMLKTPVATIVATLAALGFGLRLLRSKTRHFPAVWAAACVLIPPGVYLFSSMRTHMNIGIRHVFPLYAFGFVAVGCIAGLVWKEYGSRSLRLGIPLALLLIAETWSQAPHFISFFNTAAGGPVRGRQLLGDSNLDWGQDLPLLAEWQRAHPETPLYLSFFGMTDPAIYGIHYRALAGNYVFGPTLDSQPLTVPSVVAVSASHLQGISIGPRLDDRLAPLKSLEPREVLGGTIYLFDVPNETVAESLKRMTFP